MVGYEETVQDIRHLSSERVFEDDASRLREIVRCATLAPSSHNTQCWKFRIEDNGITVLPDLSRRCSVVDPDDHHLYVSLGCAVENLVIAARAYGLDATVDSSSPRDGVKVTFCACEPESTPLFKAIPTRQNTRREYDGTPLDQWVLDKLGCAGTGKGVHIRLLTESEPLKIVEKYTLEGSTAQMTNPNFVEEVKKWIRFSENEAISTGDGLYGKVMGSPSAPRWLGLLILKFVLRPGPENDKISKQIRSSSGIAIFSSDTDDQVHWVEAGRCYERFALQATALGVRTAMMNQAVEEPDIRPQLARALDLQGERPDLVVRFGRATEMPHSLRRSVDAVLD